MERRGVHHSSVMLVVSVFVACVLFGAAEVTEQTTVRQYEVSASQIDGVSASQIGLVSANQGIEALPNQEDAVSANQIDAVPATRLDGVSANVPVIQPLSLHSLADQLAVNQLTLLSLLSTDTMAREELPEHFANSIQTATDQIHASLEAVERVQDQCITDIQSVEEQLHQLNVTSNEATLQVQEQCTSNYQSLQAQVNQLQNRLYSLQNCLQNETKLEGCVKWKCENDRWVRYKGRQITEFSDLLGNNCIYIESAQLTWQQARAKCKAHDADLFVLKEGNQHELNVYLKTHGQQVWVGVSEHHATWLDGRPVHHSEWGTNQPDDNDDVEGCVNVGFGEYEQLHDYPCDHRGKSLCLLGVSYP